MSGKSRSKLFTGCKVRYHGRSYTTGTCAQERDGSLSWHLLGAGKRVGKGLAAFQTELWVHESELRKVKE